MRERAHRMVIHHGCKVGYLFVPYFQHYPLQLYFEVKFDKVIYHIFGIPYDRSVV